MDTTELASIYRLTATIYRMGAVVLSDDFERKGEVVARNRRAIPFYYLVSHSIELFLKCALLKRGHSPKELKKHPVGHGLDGLLDKLQELDVPVSEKANRLIRALSPQHKKHAFRYTALLDDGDMVFTPEPSDLFAVLDELLLIGRHEHPWQMKFAIREICSC